MSDTSLKDVNGYKIIIRRGVRNDCKEVARLVQELANFEEMPYGPKIDASVLEHDGFDLNPPLFRMFVAELNGGFAESGSQPKLVGYALYYNKYSTWKGKAMLLEDLYVSADYRKKKVGYALFQEVVKETVQTGCQTLDLDVLEWNPARKFYEALGGIDITESESWHFYRWNKSALDNLLKKSEG